MDSGDHLCDIPVALHQALADWDHDHGNEQEVCHRYKPTWHKADELVHGNRCDVTFKECEEDD